MAEEFEESEVVFEEDEDRNLEASNFWRNNHSGSGSGKARRKKLKTKSAPVRIPENVPWRRCTDDDLDGGEMVPPHVIVGRRRVAGDMMAFSVCTGNGRTLKGRDLSDVRNTVLRMTGFLET